MEMGKVEQLRDEVVGLRPVYKDIGNCTEILLKNGEVVQDRRVLNSVLKALAAVYAIDLKAQRRLLREKLRRKGLLPFYLGAGRIFVPLKMRKAVTENDAVYGYVDMAYMGEPRAGAGKECLIKLTNGLILKVLSSESTVHSVQHSGTEVKAVFQPYKGGDDQQEQVMEAGRIFACTLATMAKQLDRIEQDLHRKD